MIFDYISLALRNIRKRGIRSWLTMLGIFIGIAAVVSLISLGNGLQNAITGQFSQLGADKLTVSSAETGFGPPGSTAVRRLNEHDLNIIRRIPGVDYAVPRLVRTASVEYNEYSQFRYIGSMPETEREVRLIYESMGIEVEQGRLLTADDRKKVILGNDFTDNSFGKKIRVGSIITIQGEDFQVIGILKKASTFIINSVVLMPEDDMKSILDIGDEIDIITVQTQGKDVTSRVAKEIETAMRRDRNQKMGEEDFSVQTPEQSLQSVNSILLVINAVIVGIAAISLIVGGIGITNTMYTAVLERTKEIGVMKAVGAQNKDVLMIFLAESSLMGMVGGIVGATIGLTVAYLVSFAATSAFPAIDFRVTFSFPVVIGSILFALAVGTVSGIVPALQAARMKPVEAFRA